MNTTRCNRDTKKFDWVEIKASRTRKYRFPLICIKVQIDWLVTSLQLTGWKSIFDIVKSSLIG